MAAWVPRMIGLSGLFGGAGVVLREAERRPRQQSGTIEIVVRCWGCAVHRNRDWYLGNIIVGVGLSDQSRRIHNHSQRVISGIHPGYIDVLARKASGIDISPPRLNSLIVAIVAGCGIGGGRPGANIFQTKTDLVPCRNDVAVGIEQAVIGKLLEMVMAMAGGPVEQRIGRRISKGEIASPDVAGLRRKREQTMRAHRGATFDDFTIAG